MERTSSSFIRYIITGSLIKQILSALLAGIILAWTFPGTAKSIAFLGSFFIGALKSVAPILVMMLVMSSIANHQKGEKTSIRPILFLYLLGTFSAAFIAVMISFLFPSTLVLST